MATKKSMRSSRSSKPQLSDVGTVVRGQFSHKLFSRRLSNFQSSFVIQKGLQDLLPARTSIEEKRYHRSRLNSISVRKSLFAEPKQIIKKSQFPMSGEEAVSALDSELSDYEKQEVKNYKSVYYAGNGTWRHRDSSAKMSFDDDDDHLLFYKGDHIAYRYSIVSLLGMGTFGTVCKAFDHKNKEMVAIKVVRGSKMFTEQAKIELRILRTLRDTDLTGEHNVVHMKRHFKFRGHVCIVFELLENSLYELLKKRQFVGFEIEHTRLIAKQLLDSLLYIRRLGIIHCDLKPENIMAAGAKIKIIDFGSACLASNRLYSYLQSRYYRAPEIILGVKYSTPIDTWSFACIAYELRTGKPLFMGSNEIDQLLLIIETIGLPPPELLNRGKKRKQFFDETNNLRNCKLANGREIVPGSRPLDALFDEDDHDLKNLIDSCLCWVPEDRLKPKEALSHRFFSIHDILTI